MKTKAEALEAAKEKLLAMSTSEFHRLLDEHVDGDIAQIVRRTLMCPEYEPTTPSEKKLSADLERRMDSKLKEYMGDFDRTSNMAVSAIRGFEAGFKEGAKAVEEKYEKEFETVPAYKNDMPNLDERGAFRFGYRSAMKKYDSLFSEVYKLSSQDCATYECNCSCGKIRHALRALEQKPGGEGDPERGQSMCKHLNTEPMLCKECRDER